jgi:hypothetical protein
MTVTATSKAQIQYPWNPYNATAIKTWVDAVTAIVNGTLPAAFLSADTEGRAAMATGYFNEAKATDAFAAGAIVGTLLKAGAISATTAGRALMATGYFDETTATDKFAAGAITTALLKAGVISADEAGRALFATGVLDADTIASAVAAKAIDTGSIADGAIEALQLNEDAVETAKIKNANVTAAKLEALLHGAARARAGAGAVAITAPTALFTGSGGADALAVADSTLTGQRLRVVDIGGTGSGVFTNASGSTLTAGITTITLAALFDWVELEWDGAAWNPIGFGGTTTIATTS